MFALINPRERALCETLRMFEVPLPLSVLREIHGAEGGGEDPASRLLALGLCETAPDPRRRDAAALRLTGAARDLCPLPSESAQQAVSRALLSPLLAAWSQRNELSAVCARALIQPALWVGDQQAIARSAPRAIQDLLSAREAQRAAEIADKALNALRRTDPAPVLLQRAADAFFAVGDTARALRCVRDLERRQAGTGEVHVGLVRSQASIQAEGGDPAGARERLEAARRALASAGRELAALELAREIALLDVKQRKAARARGSLMHVARRMGALGARKERAVTLVHVAESDLLQGRFEGGLGLLQEAVQLFEQVGANAERDSTLARLEGLLAERALQILQPGERRLLTASALFTLPLPSAAMAAFGHVFGTPADVERLLELGVWEAMPDPFGGGGEAVRIHPRVRELVGLPPEAQHSAIAVAIIEPLYEEWRRLRLPLPLPMCAQLLELGLMAGHSAAVALAAPQVLEALRTGGHHDEGLAHARRAAEIFKEAGVPTPAAVHRLRGDLLLEVGEIADAEVVLGEADAQHRVERVAAAEAAAAEPEPPAPEPEHEWEADPAPLREDFDEEALTVDEEALALQQRLKQMPAGERAPRARVLGRLVSLEMSRGAVGAASALQGELVQIHQDLGNPDAADRGLALLAHLTLANGDVGRALSIHSGRIEGLGARGRHAEVAVVLAEIANIQARWSDLDQAISTHHERRAIFDALGDRRASAAALSDIARLRYTQGHVEHARTIHHNAHRLFGELGDARARAISMGDLARLEASAGGLDRALALHEERRGVLEGLGDSAELANTWCDIGAIRLQQGQLSEALVLYRDALHTFERLGDARSCVVALGAVGRIRLALGETSTALEIHRRRRALLEAFNDRREMALVDGDIARVHASRGDLEEASVVHAARLGVLESLGDRLESARALGDLAGVAARRGERGVALEHHDRQREILRELGARRDLAIASGEMARLAVSIGDLPRARELQGEQLAEYQELSDAVGEASSRYLLAQLVLREEGVEAAVPQLGAAWEVVSRTRQPEGLARVGEAYGQALLATGRLLEAYRVLLMAWAARHRLGRTDEVDTLARAVAGVELQVSDAAEGARRAGDSKALLRALVVQGQIALLRDDAGPARRALEGAWNIAGKGRLQQQIGAVGALYGPLLARLGRTEEAEPVLEATAQAWRRLRKADRAAPIERILEELRREPEEE